MTVLLAYIIRAVTLAVNPGTQQYYDENKQIDNVYLDIKKAFDTITHERLLLKLEKYGIDGELLSWVKDFLNGRRQRVILNGE